MGSMEEAAVALAAASDTCDTNQLMIVKDTLESGIAFAQAAGGPSADHFVGRFTAAIRQIEIVATVMAQLGSDLEQASRHLAGS